MDPDGVFQVVVQEGFKPDFKTVNYMLVSYAEMKRMDDFCWLLIQMDRLGFSIMDDIFKLFSFLLGQKETFTIALKVFENVFKRLKEE